MLTHINIPHLQAELPFKSKPKQQAPRKNPTLDQKRAVKFREPAEKQAASLVHALSAIRNAKTVKRREQHDRRQKVSLLCFGMSFCCSISSQGWSASALVEHGFGCCLCHTAWQRHGIQTVCGLGSCLNGKQAPSTMPLLIATGTCQESGSRGGLAGAVQQGRAQEEIQGPG